MGSTRHPRALWLPLVVLAALVGTASAQIKATADDLVIWAHGGLDKADKKTFVVPPDIELVFFADRGEAARG